MIKKIFFVLVTFFSVTGIQAQNKQHLSVLYVGFSPDKEMPAKKPNILDFA